MPVSFIFFLLIIKFESFFEEKLVDLEPLNLTFEKAWSNACHSLSTDKNNRKKIVKKKINQVNFQELNRCKNQDNQIQYIMSLIW